MPRFFAALGPLAGRLLLSGIFLYTGWHKFTETGRTASTIAGRGIPFATTAAYAAGAFELAVAVLVALGVRVRSVALATIAYLAVITWFVHFRAAAHGDVAQTVQVLKNAAIAGGMMLLASHGAGPASIDRG